MESPTNTSCARARAGSLPSCSCRSFHQAAGRGAGRGPRASAAAGREEGDKQQQGGSARHGDQRRATPRTFGSGHCRVLRSLPKEAGLEAAAEVQVHAAGVDGEAGLRAALEVHGPHDAEPLPSSSRLSSHME